jgi:hypothetical protein
MSEKTEYLKRKRDLILSSVGSEINCGQNIILIKLFLINLLTTKKHYQVKFDKNQLNLKVKSTHFKLRYRFS